MQKIIEDSKNHEDLVNWYLFLRCRSNIRLRSRKALIDENIEFLLAVKQYKENALNGSREIYSKFLADNSELPVNHNALVRIPTQPFVSPPYHLV